MPNDFNTKIIDEFRANAGVVGGPFAVAPMVLLSTTGAKSGKQHTTPLVYQQDGERIIVFASMGGAPTNPAWYYNLRANPAATVEVGTEQYAVKANITSGDERERLWTRQKSLMPPFAEYEKTAGRTIPVVALERA